MGTAAEPGCLAAPSPQPQQEKSFFLWLATASSAFSMPLSGRRNSLLPLPAAPLLLQVCL